MAIAYVSSAKAVQGSVGASSYTTAFTTGSGTNRCLVVLTITNQTGDFITGITYAGVSMTRRFAFDTAQAGQNIWLYGYTLAAPTSGTNNVVVSFNSTYTDDITVMTHEYTGVDQTTPTDGTGTDVLGASPSTSTIVTTIDNDWLVSSGRGASVAAAASTNTTERQSGASAGIASGDTNAAQTPAGSKTQNWTVSSGNVASGALALRPSGGAATTRLSTLLTMGVG